MKQVDIEIPYEHERPKRYVFFEKLPGLLSWFILSMPLILSLINPTIAVFFVIAYLLLWFSKTLGLNVRSIQGFRNMQRHMALPWQLMIEDLTTETVEDRIDIPDWHARNVRRYQESDRLLTPDNTYHVVVIAAYNEAREVLEPTIQSVIDCDFDMKKVILVLAYEQRGGEKMQQTAHDLMQEYGQQFKHAMAVEHPADIPGEVIGKGGNITYAARQVEQYLEQASIDPLQVLVTTLDADNRPHPTYFAALTYAYMLCPDPKVVSFQPIPLFTSNIWDAPALMRVIATGNSFWNIVQSLRPHTIRNFSSHAQSMAGLIETDYWSVRTIVEDGHQYWRTYFRFDGRHDVVPLHVPIYQDAVLSSTFRKTVKAQFLQLRRWAWGASDVAYVAEMGFFRRNKIPRRDIIAKFARLLEGHVSWATAPLLLAFAAFVPLLVNPDSYVSNQLPFVVSRIQTVALMGIFITMFLSLKTLPPKPKRYTRRRSVFMVLQWVLLPFTTITFFSLSGLYSQTRLLFGRYLGNFDVTDKAVVTDDNERVI